MDINQAVTEVLTITARPDRSAEILSALNAAISFYSSKADFALDLVETSLPISPTEYGGTVQFNVVSPTPLVTRFRKFKYVKPYGVKRYLTPIGSDKIFTPKDQIQVDKYYVGGNNITYTLKELAPSLEVGYYQYPPVLDGTTLSTHWMLDLMPWAVIDRAAARIFRSIGDDTSAVAYDRSSMELFLAARRDFEDGVVAGAA